MGYYKTEIGDVFESNSFGKFEVLALSGEKCQIRFLATGHEDEVTRQAIRKGTVYDPMIPSVFGVGYLGVGRFSSRDSVNPKRKSQIYNTWVGMLARCYNINTRSYKNYGAVGCYVCEQWLCFQSFADWYSKNIPDGSGLQLDKDALVFNNKVYGPEYCVGLTPMLNSLFRKSEKAASLMGAYKNPNYKGWTASIKIDNKRHHLGSFSTEMEAHLEWQKAKLRLYREMALSYAEDLFYNPKVQSAILARADLISFDIETQQPTTFMYL